MPHNFLVCPGYLNLSYGDFGFPYFPMMSIVFFKKVTFFFLGIVLFSSKNSCFFLFVFLNLLRFPIISFVFSIFLVGHLILFILFYWDNLISITIMYYFHIQGKNTVKNIPSLGEKKRCQGGCFSVLVTRDRSAHVSRCARLSRALISVALWAASSVYLLTSCPPAPGWTTPSSALIGLGFTVY